MSAENANEGAGASRSLNPKGARDLGGLAIAAGLFLFAALIAWDGSSYPVRQSYAQFGPEIFPYLIAAGLAVFGVATVVMALRNSFPEREPMNLIAVSWIVGALLAKIALLYSGVGFIIAAGTMFGMSARGLGRRPLWFAILVGLGVAAFLYILFRHGLSLTLPGGPVEDVIDGLFRR